MKELHKHVGFVCPQCGGDTFGSSERRDGSGKRDYYCNGHNENGCSQKFEWSEENMWTVMRQIVHNRFESIQEYHEDQRGGVVETAAKPVRKK